MANLPETPDYSVGIYQFETSDPVEGGPGGIDNRPTGQLANRTAWLKAKVDAFLDGTVAVLKATKLATARTLSVSGAASGSVSFDGSANANIPLTLVDSGAAAGTYPKVTVNAKGIVTAGAALIAADIPSLAWSKIGSGKPTTLVGYGITDAAPLASPAFTGAPQAPTPAQFDSDGSLATSEFVRRELGHRRGFSAFAASFTVGASDVGKLIQLGGPGGSTVTLPLSTSMPAGVLVEFSANNSWGVALQGGDSIGQAATSFAGIALGAGDTAAFVNGSNGSWYLVGGSAVLRRSADFGASLAANGYQKLTSGKIEQWGSFPAPANSTSTVTLPIPFPNNFRHVFLSVRDNLQAASALPFGGAVPINLSTFSLRNFYTASGLVYSYTAIGD